ncbi:PoNe immunity protein domain-containing protein [Streptococcus dentapri]|uniref:PoNe immunity protein domain-containing protein n=1 Tax=Streptococcus dentapri TaxID=573564 RepID=A0ABV8D2V9_9STRE
MFRDKHKDENYFREAYDFNIKAFQDMESMKPEVPEERMGYFYSPQSMYSKELVFMAYSLGKSNDEIFKWFKISLHYYLLSYASHESIYDLINYFSLAVLFEDRKEEFIEDIETLFNKYMTFVDEGEQLQEDYIEFLAMYLLRGERVNFHSHLEYLNLMGDTADSIIEAQKFWYYAHSEAAWYDTHKTEDAYYGYWSFDTAALCKIRGIYDERLKDLDYFPYDLLVQKDR